MQVGVRDLRNRTRQVLAAVESGDPVVLTVNGEPVADIIPHAGRNRWLSGDSVREHLATRSADPDLARDLDNLAGQTLDEL